VIAAALMRISMHCVCNLMSASSPPFLLFIETVCLSDVWPGYYFYRGPTVGAKCSCVELRGVYLLEVKVM
jgi:hypothetical protein